MKAKFPFLVKTLKKFEKFLDGLFYSYKQNLNSIVFSWRVNYLFAALTSYKVEVK
jgi:hypothetical protein